MTEADRRRHEDAKLAYAALMKFYPFSVENLDGEVWRPITDYEDYQISNFGRVKSFKQDKIIIRKPKLNVQGYLRVDLCKGGKQKWFSVHRLVAEAFIPNPEGKPEVNHRFGNKIDNRVSELEWMTGRENKQHAYDTGLKRSGSDHSRAKFTAEQVRYIREVCIPGDKEYGISALARKFGVNVENISRIYHRIRYKNVN